MQEVPALFRNGDAYTDSFEALLRNGLIEREDICKPDMNKLFDDIVFDRDRELRVLAIGAGKGGNDLPIIDALTRHRSTLHYTVVEPFHRHVDCFKSMSIQEQLPSVEIKTTYRDTGSIDITKCFIEDSEEGNKMLNYLFQCVDFRKFISRERTEYFLSYLKDECCVVDGDNVYLPAHGAEIVIMK
ncbi:uncharacterized protein LOC144439794 [Glandiceps talaboti]